MKKQILFLLPLLLFVSSCKIIKSLNQLGKEKATIYNYKYNDKEVAYLPMHHLGKQEFYDDVKKSIESYKEKGYRVYYEQISSKIDVDSLEFDKIRRKLRKIMGSSKSYKEQVEGTFLDKYVKQPKYNELGVDLEKDLRADIDYLQFITSWEKLNGELILDSIDLTTPFDQEFEKSDSYTTKQYNRVVIDYRNNYLISLINQNKDEKILIVYGEGHRKDFKKKINKDK